MHVTLFGGSFNPPHLGHLLVIEQAFELISNINEIWLLPAYRHTFGKRLIPSNARIHMASLLINELPSPLQAKVRLQTIECDQQLSGQTYETIKILKTQFPGVQFSFLMGSDQLPHFQKWGKWEELLEEMPFYIYPRAGHRHTITYPHMTLLESDTQVVTNISSTLARYRYQHDLSLKYIVPASILRYLKEKHIYQS